MPPSPCTGSIITPAVSGVMASRNAFMLPNGTWSNPSTTGPKPFWYLALPVAASMASVRPWNAPSKPDDPEALRVAILVIGAADGLDHPLIGFRARVTEEHAVGERRLDEPCGKALGACYAV